MDRKAPGCLPFYSEHVWVPHKYVERPDDMEYMREHLLPNGCHRESPLHRVFVLHGLGGIGKTQLAAHFAYTYAKSFKHVIWLSASSEFSLRKSLAAYGKRLREIQGHQADPSGDDLVTLSRLATDWLTSTEGNGALLVLDGVGGLCGQDDALNGNYIKACLGGFQTSILITTRLAHLSQLGHSRCLQRVDCDTSISIFLKWCSLDNPENSHLLELVDLLAGLPLALAAAGNVIHESGCSIKSWIEMYQQDWSWVMADASPPQLTLLGSNLQNIGSEWRASCRTIKAADATTGKFLLLWACFGHGELWHELFRPGDLPGCPEWLMELREERRFLHVVRSILRLSLAEKSGVMTYRMHPVLAKWIMCGQEWPQKDMQDCQKIALHLTASAIPPVSDVDFAARQRRLLPAAGLRVQWLKQHDSRSKVPKASFITAVGTLGSLYADQGSLKLAEWLYRRALETAHYFWNVIDVLRTQLAFAKVLARLHKNEEAEALCKSVKERCEHVGTSFLSCRAECSSDCIKKLSAEVSGSLAALSTRQGRLNDAEKLLDETLTVQKELYGMRHCSTLDTINDTGVLYTEQGLLEDAEDQFRLAFNGRTLLLGSSHPLALQTLANLGVVMARRGQLQEAEELCSKAADGVESVLGRFHDTTLSIHHNLANIYGQQGWFAEAAAKYQWVEEGCSEVFGHQHALALQAKSQAAAMLERAEICHEASMAMSLVPTDLRSASPAALSSQSEDSIKMESPK
ncbi:TPR Domain containing protein [Cordyceps javanica]|uniref:TPR Domain containing protein n=1 Tax=Cordyceps javanica TaxID=43265 RepID=A0A545ULF2_9HYPO|nr:TPR Domain containing protein [Cordyceps javanica]TQW01758.1 TPR Domain containing protein [Cordyceps javanica]